MRKRRRGVPIAARLVERKFLWKHIVAAKIQEDIRLNSDKALGGAKTIFR
jgi:hypothetical protein